MCGIVGVLGRGAIDQDTNVRMRDTMAHRGPDHAGCWRSDDGAVWLGHRRLAILDPLPEANQPFRSADGRFALTFNGEIYNFATLRAELAQHGAQFRTTSDTEVLLEAYRAWGAEAPRHMSGQFAFAIWDARRRELFCARDRAGEKPFYYTLQDDVFLFASELKAILAWPPLRRELNYEAIVDFLSFGFVPDPKSIWRGIYKLPPAHTLLVRLDAQGAPILEQPRAYWDLEFTPDHAVADWGPRIRDTLEAACAEMAIADVPLGAFLSGGVDSSSVTAALSRGGARVSTFTVGFDDAAYDERPWARQVAALYHTHHTERVVTAGDAAPVIDTLLWHYDEPFNDYSYLPTYYVCREARSAITVALSGDGADEMFAGYTKYARIALREKLAPVLQPPVSRGLAAGAVATLPPRSRLRRTVLQYSLPAESMFLDALTTTLPLPALRAAARGPLAETLRHYSPMDVIQPLLRKAPPREIGLVNTMRYLDLKLTLAGDILVKVDRASMAVSLEVRPVYLHRDLLALAARIPGEQLAAPGQAKRALKSALEPWLPNEILYRPKMGFALPLPRWLREESPTFFGPALSTNSEPLHDLLDTRYLDLLTAEHTTGATDATSILHSHWLLGRWLERWS